LDVTPSNPVPPICLDENTSEQRKASTIHETLRIWFKFFEPEGEGNIFFRNIGELMSD
jgi:hypothetical protein